MIKTGDWSTSDLVKYLVAVQTTLSHDELERLRMTSAFPKEGNGATETGRVTRFKASDLYEPLDNFRELGLPILDWGTKTKWRANSEEGECHKCEDRLNLTIMGYSQVPIRPWTPTNPTYGCHVGIGLGNRCQN